VPKFTVGKTRIIDAFQRQLDDIEKRWPMSGSYERIDPYLVPHMQAGKYFELLIYHKESRDWFDNTNFDTLVDKMVRQNLINDGDVAFDLGSNAGAVTVVMADMAGESGHIHAFDPYPWNAAATDCNAKLNYFANVTAHAVGLSNRDYKIKVDPTDSRTTNESSLEGAQELTIRSLQRFLYLKPRFLKIDIEGAEYELFQDLSADALSSVRGFALEYHPGWIQMRGLDVKQGLVHIVGAGFSLHYHDNFAPSYDPNNYDTSHHLFWGKRNAIEITEARHTVAH
jgi:FkbM family methyltransferase